MNIEKKTLRNIFIGVIVCIVLYWILHETERVKAIYGVLQNVFSPFVTGAAIAFILNVPMRAIEGLMKGIKHNTLRRSIAVVLTFLAVALILTLVFLLLIPQMTDTVQSLIPKLQSFASTTEGSIRSFLSDNPELLDMIEKYTDIENMDWSSLAQKAASWLGNSVSQIWGTTISAIGSITGALMEIFIALVFAIYCLFAKETLARQGRKLVYAFFPEKFADGVVRVIRLTNSTFSNFLSGQCIEVCILGALFAVAMAIFRMPYIPLVSVLVAVTAFIPVVGAWAGCVLGAFFILVANPIQAVWFVIMFVVLQQIENNLIYPRVVGTSIGLSGMWVLVAVAVGGEFMGVAGMFLMIPIASVIYVLLSEKVKKLLADKEIDPEKLKPQEPELRSKFKERREKRKEKKNAKKLAEKKDK
ncbi:MAG: AI-2E family transporter [Oscillospiraceae bacterium]|nr:AI-2E family transporter [Oscillospiraceae bacterium]